MMIPGLKHIAGKLGDRFPGERNDLDSEILEGFLQALDVADARTQKICAQLAERAERYGLQLAGTHFAAGQVTTAAARALHVGVRTVTYWLNRVRELTGYAVDDPAQSFMLQVAVLGARLLGWPDGDLPR